MKLYKILALTLFFSFLLPFGSVSAGCKPACVAPNTCSYNAEVGSPEYTCRIAAGDEYKAGKKESSGSASSISTGMRSMPKKQMGK